MQAGVERLLTLPGLALMAVLALASCAPSYDEQSDKAISDLQHKVDAKIVSLISIDRRVRSLQGGATPSGEKLKDSATFAANADFYDDVDSDLTSAQMRVGSSPDLSTPKIQETFASLRGILVEIPRPGDPPASMQAVHAAQGRLGEGYLRSTRAQVNSLFATLMQYQMTIKAGRTPSK